MAKVEGEIKIEERGRKKKGVEWSLLGVRGKRGREGNSRQNSKMGGEELREERGREETLTMMKGREVQEITKMLKYIRNTRFIV